MGVNVRFGVHSESYIRLKTTLDRRIVSGHSDWLQPVDTNQSRRPGSLDHADGRVVPSN